MKASFLPPFFLENHSLSISSLGCKAFCIVISLLSFALFFEVLPSSILRIVPCILPVLPPRCLYLFMKFLLGSLVSHSSELLFKFFLSSPLVWLCPLPIFPSICKFPISERSDFFYWFGSSVPSVICIFPLFIRIMAHFPIPNSIPISWLHIFIEYIRVSDSFLFL